MNKLVDGLVGKAASLAKGGGKATVKLKMKVKVKRGK